MKRVVFAVREPDRFVRCRGEQSLRDAGIEVCVLESLAKQALKANAHIPPNPPRAPMQPIAARNVPNKKKKRHKAVG